MVQVVELADRGEAGLQHLDEGEGGDRLDVVGREPVEEAVHDLAPGPEAVGGGPAALGQARHAALEGVAVQVRQARHRGAREARRVAGLDAPVSTAAMMPSATVTRTSSRQPSGSERGREMQLAHAAPGP